MKFLLGLALLAGVSPAMAVQTKPIIKPWLRLDGDLGYTKLAPKGRYLAFSNSSGKDLRVLDIEKKQTLFVSRQKIGASFFWAPDGSRLFYRELRKTKAGEINSEVFVFNARQAKSTSVATYPHATGVLTYDPRTMNYFLMHNQGIHSQRIFFPDERLARWQVAQRTDLGTWVAAQNGMTKITEAGFAMHRLKDDGSALQSFAISPDGTALAWATEAGNIYISTPEDPVKKIGVGQDPSWHPFKLELIYAAARLVGNTPVDYDLRVVNTKGSGRYLTFTQGSPERWPVWSHDGERVLFTKDRSTDLFQMRFERPVEE